jgi:hypothetical protein
MPLSIYDAWPACPFPGEYTLRGRAESSSRRPWQRDGFRRARRPVCVGNPGKGSSRARLLSWADVRTRPRNCIWQQPVFDLGPAMIAGETARQRPSWKRALFGAIVIFFSSVESHLWQRRGRPPHRSRRRLRRRAHDAVLGAAGAQCDPREGNARALAAGNGCLHRRRRALADLRAGDQRLAADRLKMP